MAIKSVAGLFLIIYSFKHVKDQINTLNLYTSKQFFIEIANLLQLRLKVLKENNYIFFTFVIKSYADFLIILTLHLRTIPSRNLLAVASENVRTETFVRTLVTSKSHETTCPR